ncbi:MAG: alpha/beta hydrolase [Fibrobacter sp.]|nr:alpha/beta hydrolase [Fibrobacter sp.]
MKFLLFLRDAFFKILRLLGIVAVLYAGIVVYLMLSERRTAFPRAVADSKARTFIEASRYAAECRLQDGLVLHGWDTHPEAPHTLVYFPDQNEDAASFLADMKLAKSIRSVAFNYRGSGGDNSGTPSEKFAMRDAEDILKCALSLSGSVSLAGRGTGAIYAFNLAARPEVSRVILIDPVPSIAAAISDKYRVLFPRFLIRTQTRLETVPGRLPGAIYIIEDRTEKRKLVEETKQFIGSLPVLPLRRGGGTLESVIQPLFTMN